MGCTSGKFKLERDERWRLQSSASSEPWELIVAIQYLPATKLKSEPEPDSLSASAGVIRGSFN